MEAWIEINNIIKILEDKTSPPIVEAWIEIDVKYMQQYIHAKSPPIVEAWIEIQPIYEFILPAIRRLP